MGTVPGQKRATLCCYGLASHPGVEVVVHDTTEMTLAYFSLQPCDCALPFVYCIYSTLLLQL